MTVDIRHTRQRIVEDRAAAQQKLHGLPPTDDPYGGLQGQELRDYCADLTVQLDSGDHR